MKPRKTYKNNLSNEKRIIKKGTIEPRNYETYLKFLVANRPAYISQMDLVQELKGNCEPYLMTFIFPFSNLMFDFLIKSKEQNEIVKVFNQLEDKLGLEDFKKLFPAILTDRGNKFLDADGIELSKDDRTPYEIFEFIYGYKILEKLNIKKIDFNEIDLTRNLIIKYRNK